MTTAFIDFLINWFLKTGYIVLGSLATLIGLGLRFAHYRAQKHKNQRESLVIEAVGEAIKVFKEEMSQGRLLGGGMAVAPVPAPVQLIGAGAPQDTYALPVVMGGAVGATEGTLKAQHFKMQMKLALGMIGEQDLLYLDDSRIEPSRNDAYIKGIFTDPTLAPMAREVAAEMYLLPSTPPYQLKKLELLWADATEEDVLSRFKDDPSRFIEPVFKDPIDMIQWCWCMVSIFFDRSRFAEIRTAVDPHIPSLAQILEGLFMRAWAMPHPRLIRASTWAMYWLCEARKDNPPVWLPNDPVRQALASIVETTPEGRHAVRALRILVKCNEQRTVFVGDYTNACALALQQGDAKRLKVELRAFEPLFSHVIQRRFHASDDPELRLACAEFMCRYGIANDGALTYLTDRVDMLDQKTILRSLVPYAVLHDAHVLIDAVTRWMCQPKEDLQFLAALIVQGKGGRFRKDALARLKDQKNGALGLLRRTKRSSSGSGDKVVDDFIRMSNDRCYQVTGKDTTGRRAWYFILVDPDQVETFLGHKPGDSYDLADFGKIIASGYGDTVPDDVKEMLKEKYGFDNF